MLFYVSELAQCFFSDQHGLYNQDSNNGTKLPNKAVVPNHRTAQEQHRYRSVGHLLLGHTNGITYLRLVQEQLHYHFLCIIIPNHH